MFDLYVCSTLTANAPNRLGNATRPSASTQTGPEPTRYLPGTITHRQPYREPIEIGIGIGIELRGAASSVLSSGTDHSATVLVPIVLPIPSVRRLEMHEHIRVRVALESLWSTVEALCTLIKQHLALSGA